MDCASFSIPNGPCRYEKYIGLEGGTIQAKAKYIQYHHVAIHGPFRKAVCRVGVLTSFVSLKTL